MARNLFSSPQSVGVALALLGVALVAAGWYGYARITSLSEEVELLHRELAVTAKFLQDNIAAATTSLADALEVERQNVASKLGDVEDKVGEIGGTVTELEKLSKIDPELLKKYSRVFFLSENYVPAQLTDIPTGYRYNENVEMRVIPQVYPYLKKLLDRAKDDGIALYVNSAYRSFSTQAAIKTRYTFIYGAGTANQFSADQGYSEHQLGTTVDFITTGLGGQLDGFQNTAAYAWLLEHAYRYGFVLSYPENNGYYIFEPWHWRFVGVKLASDLHAAGEHFYSMDQRTIDTYLLSLFD